MGWEAEVTGRCVGCLSQQLPVCGDKCLAGTHLWTLGKSWTGQVALVRPWPAAIWDSSEVGEEAEALPWCRSSLGNSSLPPSPWSPQASASVDTYPVSASIIVVNRQP